MAVERDLFETFEMSYITMKNRLVRSATWEGVAGPDGELSDKAFQIYEELAKGGVGLIITGFTSVSAHDAYLENPMRLADDAMIPQYRELVDRIHAHDVPVIAQLALGRFYREQSDGSWEITEPDVMTVDEIQEVEREFIEAAVRAKKAGFDGVQIHAAHFFFLNRFISPAVNHRTDAYGGSVRNRGRILIEILRGILEEAPGIHVTVKINCSDFMADGLTPEMSLQTCRLLVEGGIHSIEVSGNNPSRKQVRAHQNEAYFADFAKVLARLAPVPVVLTGGLRSRSVMEELVRTTDIALMGLSRPLLRTPDYPNRMEEEGVDDSLCLSCNACFATPAHACIFR